MTHDAFVRLMQTIADAWNAGDTARALACFADDALAPRAGSHRAPTLGTASPASRVG
ncbi:MAG TPA: hypothetical protein VJ913_06580 [Actinomycetota bacterium]|nr:hypothetical protein [Actinomycetota bacterium]